MHLRAALADLPYLLTQVPDTAGKVDALPPGVGKLAVRKDKRVVWQGAFSRGAGGEGMTDTPSGAGETRSLLVPVAALPQRHYGRRRMGLGSQPLAWPNYQGFASPRKRQSARP
jgi:hypothetical protein